MPCHIWQENFICYSTDVFSTTGLSTWSADVHSVPSGHLADLDCTFSITLYAWWPVTVSTHYNQPLDVSQQTETGRQQHWAGTRLSVASFLHDFDLTLMFGMSTVKAADRMHVLDVVYIQKKDASAVTVAPTASFVSFTRPQVQRSVLMMIKNKLREGL